MTAIEYAILDLADMNPSEFLTDDRITEYAMVRRYPASREVYRAAFVLLKTFGFLAVPGIGSVVITEKGKAALLEARTELSKM